MFSLDSMGVHCSLKTSYIKSKIEAQMKIVLSNLPLQEVEKERNTMQNKAVLD